jgi:UV DNA damage endonuclease
MWNHLLFFRISSDLIPFASHPICKYNWLNHFKSEFKEIGDYIIRNNMRISMHPDQFVLINSTNDKATNDKVAWTFDFLFISISVIWPLD